MKSNKKIEYYVTKSLFFSYFFIFSSNAVVGPLIPSIHENLKISYSLIGTMIFIGYLFTIIFTLILGRFFDHFNKYNIIFISFFITLLGNIFLFFSNNFYCFTLGFTLATMGVITHLIYGDSFLVSTYGAKGTNTYNTVHAIAAFGVAWASILVFIVYISGIYWKYVFIFNGIILLIFIFIYLKIGIRIRYKSPKMVLKSVKNSKEIYANIFGNIFIYLTSFLLFFHFALRRAFPDWLSTYALTINIKPEYGILMVAAFSIAAGIARFTLNSMQKKLRTSNILIIITLVSLISIISINFIDFVALKFVFIFILGGTIGLIHPILTFFIMNENINSTSTVGSITYSVEYSAVMIMGLITGIFTDKIGGKAIIYIAIVNCFLITIGAIIFNIFLRKKNKISQS